MRDPYLVLGISKSSSADEIKSAYRKLAKKMHPDVNPGRKDIEQKFKEITAAYDLLSDPAKRARFDRGELDADGNERGFAGGDPFGGSRGNWRTRQSSGGDPFAGFGNADDIFAEFMNRGRRGGASGAPRGQDITYSLSIPFTEACLGGKRRVTLANSKTIDVNIPAGVMDGHKLRLRGLGEPSLGTAGDAIVEVHVEPHPYFVRKEFDITIEVPISLPESLLGASIKVPTLDGHVSVKVPKGANTDTSLRLKGKGVPKTKDMAGDMYVKLKVMLPDDPPTDLVEYIEKWAKKHTYDPRKNLW